MKNCVKRYLTTFIVLAVCLSSMGIYELWSGKSTSSYASENFTYKKQLEQNADGTYNLSLDVESDEEITIKEAKVDIVLVIDTSGSMTYSMSGKQSSGVATSERRMTIAKDSLTGNGGFIDAMVENENINVNLSVVQFASDVSIVSDWKNISNSATDVAQIKSSINSLSATGSTLAQGGIRTAKTLFNNARSDAKKLMVFVSDGEPSLCYSKADDIYAYVTYKGTKTSGVSNSYILYRYYADNTDERYVFSVTDDTRTFGKDDEIVGTGSTDAPGYSAYTWPGSDFANAKSGTKGYLYVPTELVNGVTVKGATVDSSYGTYLEHFCSNRALKEATTLPELDGVYSLAVSDTFDAYFLQNLAEVYTPVKEGGARNFEKVTTASAFATYCKNLAQKIDQQICYGIQIKDKLSDYVDLASEPDYRAEIYDASGNLIKTVRVGEDGYPFETVTYDNTTRTVIAGFKDNFVLEKGYKYGVKFNVEVNENAYYAYFTNVQDGKSGYPNTGSTGSGASSDGKEGFYSNNGADVTVSYGAENPNVVTKVYAENPVVQIDTAKNMTIKKVWEDAEDKDKQEIKATLIGTSTSGKGTTITKEVTLNSANNWEVRVEGLPAKYYTYAVTEDTVLPGFYDEGIETKTKDDGSFETTITNKKIKFDIKDGNETEIYSGESIDIKKLVFDDSGQDIMTKELQNLIKDNPTICGKITYQWVDQDGNSVGNATIATITSSERTLPEIPSYTFTGTEVQVGTPQVFSLKVTFENADGSVIVSDGDVKVNVKHTVIPTGVRNKLIPGLLALVMMGTFTIIAKKIFAKRKISKFEYA